jgi:hypothetical protein
LQSGCRFESAIAVSHIYHVLQLRIRERYLPSYLTGLPTGKEWRGAIKGIWCSSSDVVAGYHNKTGSGIDRFVENTNPRSYTPGDYIAFSESLIGYPTGTFRAKSRQTNPAVESSSHQSAGIATQFGCMLLSGLLRSLRGSTF